MLCTAEFCADSARSEDGKCNSIIQKLQKMTLGCPIDRSTGSSTIDYYACVYGRRPWSISEAAMPVMFSVLAVYYPALARCVVSRNDIRTRLFLCAAVSYVRHSPITVTQRILNKSGQMKLRLLVDDIAAADEVLVEVVHCLGHAL